MRPAPATIGILGGFQVIDSTGYLRRLGESRQLDERNPKHHYSASSNGKACIQIHA
jgi:hypothetical protein